ncbi:MULTISPECIES: helix-turn-helix transcriptional regulator [unclassified Microbulbifer]|uniref:helix-turn-helix domain-containing protein n=1 Tax=unclassified Microbulbifer TaxID=2619833 RepID=UPI0027E47ABE|nr:MULTISPECIES: helix-turn-helix transcriptional regulator [unclassified Microbulbifer]
MNSLGTQFKLLRAERNWSQTEAARKIGIEQSYLSKLENDQASASIGILKKVCRAYNTDITTLFRDVDQNSLRGNLHYQSLLLQTRKRKNQTLLTASMAFGLAVSVASVWLLNGPTEAKPLQPVHETLSMHFEDIEARQAIELFAEFGGLKIRGLDLVSGKIDKLKLENTPWDAALTEVAHKLNLRAEISGSYVTLVPQPDSE